jgi:hypothetical protein
MMILPLGSRMNTAEKTIARTVRNTGEGGGGRGEGGYDGNW